MIRYALTLLACLVAGTSLPAAEDVLIADFEQETYGRWQVEGEAFGPGPASGTLPGQMHVSGYRGDRLVNSFFSGDGTTGTLTSPPLKIERRYLTFLIGGGGYPQETCINLLVDGEVVRTATGPNTESGGSEELAPHFWDVEDLLGRTATIQIVDAATGGWGHINVDHLVLSDRKPEVPNRNAVLTKRLDLQQHYLLFPIRTGARSCPVDLEIDGRNVREFDAELAASTEDVSFWAFLDITPFAGKSATLRVKRASAQSLELIHQADEIPGAENLYTERLRPQFHFSQMVGWNNDPNGMVYYDGQWHLFFQHNPYGWSWGNMHWGHAVSTDLVHWEQLPIAIYNKRRGDYAFSGGAVVDEHNTTGWQTGDEKVIVASWTSTGRGECLAYSNDRGRTFKEYEGNPVVQHDGRDPKIVWYGPGRHWVMVVYDESKEYGQAIAFYTSPDMKEWKLQSRLPGYYECPELLELPVDGDRENRRWVVFAADARYAIGTFDGKTFTPEHEGKHRLHYGNYYASQVFSNAPGRRKIQIGWARIAMPGMPFNQTFTFPHELSLRSTEQGVRLFAEPVEEIETLYKRSHTERDRPLTAGEPLALPLSGELFDVEATFEIGDARFVGLDFGDERLTYDASSRQLSGVSLEPIDGQVTMRALVDRPMLEIIGNDGRIYITRPREPKGHINEVKVFAAGGDAKLVRLQAHELESIWNE